jgi:transcription antitermination factor NusA-like protein
MEPAKERVGWWGEEVKRLKNKLKGESLACIQASLPSPLFLTSVINGKAPTWYIYTCMYVCMYVCM